MSDVVIRVENLGKRYTLTHAESGRGRHYSYRRFSDVLMKAIKAPAERLLKGRTERQPHQDFWALKNISFEVNRGDVLGIIGRNGAGKSTLLKILSRITDPSEGRIEIDGHVASLLEVGTGFHPELTGRENIFLNGAILGMPRLEIKRKFDEIVAFAEIDKFLDMPVKHYSSGMYVRLAFSVAAHLEPDILVVDEVLAVGDAAFQKKCLGKMERVAAQDGRTVLFVSHQMQAVNALCTRAILLTAGLINREGPAGAVIDYYNRLVSGNDSISGERRWSESDPASGNDEIRLRRVATVTQKGGTSGTMEISESFELQIEYANLSASEGVIVSLYVYSADGTVVMESLSAEVPGWEAQDSKPGVYKTTCLFPENLLNQGTFTIRLVFLDNRLRKLLDFQDAITVAMCDSEPRSIPYYGKYSGDVHPKLLWDTMILSRHP